MRSTSRRRPVSLICEQPHDEQVIFYAEAVLRSRTKEAMAKAEKEVHAGFFGDVQRMKQVVERDIAERDRHGVFTVSSRRNRTLMWSHYADKHRGFCVGLDPHHLDVFLQSLGPPNIYSSRADPTEVQYAARYPLFIPSRMSDEDYLEGWFAHKASVWRYEREYRYVVPNIQDRVVTIWSKAITEVILGCEMPPSDREEIIKVISMRDPKPRLFEALRKKHAFGLSIVEVKC
jgi:hypothetical protein